MFLKNPRLLIQLYLDHKISQRLFGNSVSVFCVRCLLVYCKWLPTSKPIPEVWIGFNWNYIVPPFKPHCFPGKLLSPWTGYCHGHIKHQMAYLVLCYYQFAIPASQQIPMGHVSFIETAQSAASFHVDWFRKTFTILIVFK